MARMMKEAQTDAARLQVAEKARQDNDIEAACRIYLRVAGSRVNSQAKLTAKQRLEELQTEAQDKFDDVQNRLVGFASTSANEQTDATRDGLCRCIEEFETLAKLYSRVPQVGREMRSALAKQKKEPSIRAVTQEPEAQRLWEIAQKFEDEGQQCCAFQVYEEGARQLPAPSARLAADRLAEMKDDPTLVASAEACRNLQWCHRTFSLASRVAKVKPNEARKLFEQVVARAPIDSKVHFAAREEIANL
jgi:DNA-directed RNA polymerase subunit F